MMEAFRGQLGLLSGWDALAMVIGVAVIYVAISLLIALFRQRLGVRVSVFSVALLTVMGSVAARAMLGRNPTMLGALLVLVELLVLQAVFYRLRRSGVRRGIRPSRAKAVMVDGVVNAAMLASTQLREQELWVRLRRAGITRRDQVAYAIIESDGSLTVIRAGTPVEPELLAGVAGLS